jgi:hypothetical protein
MTLISPFDIDFGLWTLATVAKFLISAGLGFSSFSLAIILRKKSILQGAWYFTLRILLGALAVSAFSNVYAILLLHDIRINPTELMMDLSVFALVTWIWSFYRCNLVSKAGGLSFEKVLKFVHNQLDDDKQ